MIGLGNKNIFISIALALLLAACQTVPKQAEVIKPEIKTPEAKVKTPEVKPQAVPVRPPPKIALALGGGAARGFAHIGVIKVLEAQGIVPDIVVGTSAGSVIGSLYAAGYNGFQLQELAMQLDKGQISDWAMPNRGVIKGEALEGFINQAVKQRPLEKLSKLFAVVATDLHSGEMIVFRTGNTGMAVRASSSVPGIFQPVAINHREYVDGGLVSPVPVRVARSLGADFVIAVNISAQPQDGKTESSLEIMLQTFSIMGQALSRNELPAADVVIRPITSGLSATTFNDRNAAVLEGEKAATAVLPELKAKLEKLRNEGR